MPKGKCERCGMWVEGSRISKRQNPGQWLGKRLCQKCHAETTIPCRNEKTPTESISDPVQVDDIEMQDLGSADNSGIFDTPESSIGLDQTFSNRSDLTQSSSQDSDAPASNVSSQNSSSESIASNQVDVPAPDVPAPDESQGSTSSNSTVGTEANLPVIFLPDIDTVMSTQRYCFICKRSDQRRAVPREAVRQVWTEKNIYIPKSNRCCPSHFENEMFTEDAISSIRSTTRGVHLSASEITEWLLDLTNRNKHKPRIDFSSKNDLTDEEYRTLLPCSKTAYEEMYQLIQPRMRDSANRTKRNALAMFLMVLRLDLTQNFIGLLFRVDQRVVSEAIKTVSDLLLELHTPKHIGLGVTSREDAMTNSRVLFNELYGGYQSVVRIADGTYLDIEKPGKYEEQKKTFSPQKHKNLLKMMMVAYPSGRLEEVFGPFYSDGGNNDAKIMDYCFECTPLRQHVEDGDVLLLDRGFRDCRASAEAAGFQVYMPHFLPNGQRQFTTQQANESRRLTAGRFVIEVVNGRVKNVFPFFAGKIEAPYKPQMGKFFRIACGILNAYYGSLFEESDEHFDQARRIIHRIDMRNLLQERIETMGFNSSIRNHLWQTADQNSVPDFPRLSLEDIKELTGGVFQLNNARRYTEQHEDIHGNYQIYLHQQATKLIRCQLHSRFSGQTKHNTWVEYSTDHVGIGNIVGYYCTCKNGARVVGTCSHVTCVIRFLGYDRHLPEPENRRIFAPAIIIDAATALARHRNLASEGENDFDL